MLQSSAEPLQQSSVVSEHPTPADAFREIKRLESDLERRGGLTSDAELLVVDADGVVVPRSAVS